MKKIIYLQQEVEIGDVVIINGLTIYVTDEVVQANPQLFRVIEEDIPEYVEWTNETYDTYFTVGKIYKFPYPIDDSGYERKGIYTWESWKGYCIPSSKEAYDKQELLAEAKRRYKIGDKVKGIGGFTKDDILKYDSFCWSPNGMGISSYGDPWVYFNGEWAEILKPIFKTDDGVNIYKGDTIYSIPGPLNTLRKPYSEIITEEAAYQYGHGYWVTFSTKELAEEYIAKNKVKTLEDYENILLDNKKDKSNIGSWNLNLNNFYLILKGREPKLYYQKVLQLIADDLNEGWKPNWSGYKNNYSIRLWANKEYGYVEHSFGNQANIYFKSKELAQKAIDIIGDKLELIFQ